MSGSTSFRHTIAARLILLVLVVALPLLGLQLYNAFDAAAAARQDALNDASSAAQDVVTRIDRQVRYLDSLLYAVASIVPLGERPSQSAGNQTLQKIMAAMPKHIGAIWLTDTDGTLLYSSHQPPPAGRINLADRDYFKEAIGGDGLSISDPVVSPDP
jgi:C4-dicarboxylate-specific signal transduction histidine kinase